ncbi:MAG: S-layer homology domain-containing protein [Clostridia bacterium]|nr:S-layer homology domain-containing protein [Clostridia bacterium]
MKRIVFPMVIIILLLSVCFAVQANFSDLDKSHWAYDTIIKMFDEGLIKGYEDNTFKPEKEVTREEFAQMVYNTVKQEATTEQLQNYFDVPNTKWSYNAVQLVGNSLKETSDGYVYFYPEKPIQRQEVAKVLYDFFELYEPNMSYIEGFPSSLTNNVKEEYQTAVIKVYQVDLMKGVSEDNFAPEKSLTRAEAATLISRIADRVKGETVEPIKPQESDKDFNLDFLKLENNKKNLIYSPLSIKYAMKMLVEGADGKTKEEIEGLISGFELTKYKNIEKILSLANSIFIRDTYKDFVKEEFVNQVKDKYDAEIKIDAFADAKNANNWISDKTFGIIKNMLKDELVQNPDCEMLLINALAIDMEWANRFSFDKTNGRKFTTEDGKEINATTMFKEETKSDSISYFMDDKITVLSMDLKKYDDVQLEFDAIMPKGNLSEFIKGITGDELKEILGKTTKASNTKDGLDIYIPKFKFNYDLGLKNDLKELGMVEAFSKYDANFTKMTNNPRGLYVGEALHKADIDFSEEGIKAAAVTVFAMDEKASFIMDPPKPIVVRIDRPFMFLIRDKVTGEIWFVGSVYSPNLWENDQASYASKF